MRICWAAHLWQLLIRTHAVHKTSPRLSPDVKYCSIHMFWNVQDYVVHVYIVTMAHQMILFGGFSTLFGKATLVLNGGNCRPSASLGMWAGNKGPNEPKGPRRTGVIKDLQFHLACWKRNISRWLSDSFVERTWRHRTKSKVKAKPNQF